VAGLVGADPLEGVGVLGGRGDLDESPVGRLGTGLDGGVEIAVAPERLISQLPPEGGRDQAGDAGGEDERGGGRVGEPGGVRGAQMAGGRRPPGQCTLQLVAVDEEGGKDPAGSEELATEVLGVELLVLPDPDEGLADQGAHVLVDLELGHARRHGLLPVGHGHDLLTFHGQEQEARPLLLGPIGVPPLPLVDDTVDLGQ
jgi:hypothetical protein